MKMVKACKHRNTRFLSVQRLGDQSPIELRLCLNCHSTVSVPVSAKAAAADRASD